MSRKTRLVCVSDTHAYTPSEAGFRLPAGDVLIHAGDLTTQGSLAELRKTMAWIAKAPYEVKIIIAGNHDTGLDPTQAETSQHKHHQQQCIEAVKNYNDASIVYLCHESARIRLTRTAGPPTEFTVFGSPYTPWTSPTSKWKAFGYDSNLHHQNSSKTGYGGGIWDHIPLETDLVVTHTPPYAHRDRHDGHSGHSSSGDPRARPVGCPALRQALHRVRPRIAVCGHVHESRGCERLLWLPLPLVPPASPSSWQMTRDGTEEQDPILTDVQAQDSSDSSCQVVTVDLPPIGSKKQSLVHATTTTTSTRSLQTPTDNKNSHSTSSSPSPPQQETCLINAAILATSWPHPAGKRFHTPVVVEVDFPTTSLQRQ